MIGVITAGGEGTRLYPLTRAYPKELIPFCGIPILEYGIDLFKKNGIGDIYIVTGRKKGALSDYLGSGETFGVNIAFVTQEEPKGLADAVLKTKNYIVNSRDDDFVLLLGDTILRGYNDLGEMINLHKKEGATSTILVEKVTEPERFGVVKFKKLENGFGAIESLYEKPKTPELKKEYEIDGKWHAIAGAYVFEKDIFDYIEQTEPDANNEIQLTDSMKLALRHDRKTIGYILKGKRIDVGTWDYLKEEQNTFQNISEEDLNEIINKRKNLMEKFKNK